MRQTDTHEDHGHMDWTVIKRETLASVFKSSHPNISNTTPTDQRLFIVPWPTHVPVRLACALTEKQKKVLLSGKWLNPFNTLSVMIRVMVVIKASLQTFCL